MFIRKLYLTYDDGIIMMSYQGMGILAVDLLWCLSCCQLPFYRPGRIVSWYGPIGVKWTRGDQ